MLRRRRRRKGRENAILEGEIKLLNYEMEWQKNGREGRLMRRYLLGFQIGGLDLDCPNLGHFLHPRNYPMTFLGRIDE